MVALVGIDVAGKTDELSGTALIVLAAVGYAIGPMVLKVKLPDMDARAMMGGSLAIAARDAGDPRGLHRADVDAAGQRAGLDRRARLVCTALAFIVFSVLIREVGPGKALVITYVNPVVAVALGVIILGERPGTGAVAGLLLILAGSWLSTDGRLPPGLARRLAALRRSPARDKSLLSEAVA